MNRSLTMYHNPRCSKSRATLQLLQQHGIEPRIVTYLDDPPSPAEIARLLAGLGMRPRDLMRRGEAAYRALGLDDPALGEEELIAAMHANPILIERPIVVDGDTVVLGRPPENVLALL